MLWNSIDWPLELFVDAVLGPSPTSVYFEPTLGPARAPSDLAGRNARESAGGVLLGRGEGRKSDCRFGRRSFEFSFFDFFVHLEMRNGEYYDT